jgi:hypothetical protein
MKLFRTVHNRKIKSARCTNCNHWTKGIYQTKPFCTDCLTKHRNGYEVRGLK